MTLVNLGMRRTGLVEGTEEERDPDQVRLAIEAVRALLPLLEQSAPGQVRQVRDALSQLQLAYVRIGGQAAEAAVGESPAANQPRRRGQPAKRGHHRRNPARPGPPSAVAVSGCPGSSRRVRLPVVAPGTPA